MTSLYLPLLTIHNYFRWIVLLLLLYSLYRAYLGWVQERDWKSVDQKSGLFFTSALDFQLLLGLIIFGVLGFNTTNQMLTEHMIPMFLAVVMSHIGRSRIKNAEENTQKHKQTAIWLTISLVIIALSIPWYRPLLRGL